MIGHLIGHVGIDDIQRLSAAQRVFCEGKSDIFLVVDVRRMVHITAEARRLAAVPVDSTTRIQGIAVIGATFHFRVVGTMLFSAAKVLRGLPDLPVRFFETEEDARAWFAARRHELGLSPVTSHVIVDEEAVSDGVGSR